MQFFWNQGVYIRKEFNSPGFVQSLEFLKKCRNLQSNFSDLQKGLENRDKVWERW